MQSRVIYPHQAHADLHLPLHLLHLLVSHHLVLQYNNNNKVLLPLVQYLRLPHLVALLIHLHSEGLEVKQTLLLLPVVSVLLHQHLVVALEALGALVVTPM